MKSKIRNFLLVVILLLISIFILIKFTNKAPFIEYVNLGETCNGVLEMNQNEFLIEQEFLIPYNLFYGLGFNIGTYGRENNSRYEIIVTDKTTNKIIIQQEFNASNATDGKIFEMLLKSPIKVDSTHKFSVLIKARTAVNAENGIAFYIDQNSANQNLYYNGSLTPSTLCMNIYGGNSNLFYFIFTIMCELYIFALVLYAVYLNKNNKSIIKNGIIQSGILGIIVFLMMSAFVNVESFCDEIDNIVGGMLVNKGYNLYSDYYTQHTPLAYLLCTIFNIFQAGSVDQFRLIYYAVIAIFYSFVYLRYKDSFGKINMMLLPIIQIVFGVMFASEFVMILSDNIQAILLTVLFLEFLQYLKDEKLDFKRCIVVSFCIFCSFGVAFVSAYAIFAIVLGVFLKEILYWRKNLNISIKNMFTRYWKLVISCLIPFGLAFICLVFTHSLSEAYEQAFKFNTEVYPVYIKDGYGSNIFQPFFIGISNLLQIIPNAIVGISKNENIVVEIAKLLLGIYTISIFINLIKNKKFLEVVTIALFISFSFTRTNEGFHEISAWFAILATTIIYTDFKQIGIIKNVLNVLFITFVLISISAYFNLYTQNIFISKKPVSEIEKEVIEKTVDGEKIFMDIYSYPTEYFVYKNRLPVNKLTFVLPWYLDWYELEVINDLSVNQPKIVIYDEDLKAWEISGYDDYFRKVLNENYEKSHVSSKVWEKITNN